MENAWPPPPPPPPHVKQSSSGRLLRLIGPPLPRQCQVNHLLLLGINKPLHFPITTTTTTTNNSHLKLTNSQINYSPLRHHQAPQSHMESDGDDNGGSDADLSPPPSEDVESEPPAASTVPDDWKYAINRVVPSVVVLRVTACRSFDTDLAGSYSATGFVVDKLRGIILTNRHVVKPGPVVAQAIFVNHEEIPVYPLYRDPVHDFGFCRYDPGAIKHLEYEEIPLAPEAAQVGLEIRVVGNDSSEKVSILAGTLARTDRDAPTYKRDGYNDFNTFYMQAASGTKGGSSGSPVIDRQGRAVALNAGGKTTSSSSSFYLPLDRVVRALQYLQKGRDSYKDEWQAVSIPRGTLQVTFRHKGFEETRRLGLQSETEQMVRHASPLGETGMLVVDTVVPGGPAYNLLEPGDVLICVKGEVTTRFLKLETFLDDSVHQNIEMQIERGGTSLTINILVQDLHSITPDNFLEISGTVMHPLSYQQARNFSFECGLVYVATPGYMLLRAGVPRHAIIKNFASMEISGLDELILALSKLSRGAQVPLQYITYKDRHQRKTALVTIDRHEWYDAPKIYSRDDNSGLWIPRPAIQPQSQQGSSCGSHRELGLNGDEYTLAENMHHGNKEDQTNASLDDYSREENIVKTNMQQMQGKQSTSQTVVNGCFSSKGGDIDLEASNSTKDSDSSGAGGLMVASSNALFPERQMEPSLVLVEVNVPPSCLLDGVDSQQSFGTGVILHHAQGMGLVAVDKNTVKVSASDIVLSFAAFPIEIPGQVIFLHPVYNYALVCYDPSALGIVGLSKTEPALCRGDPVHLVVLTRNLRAKSRKSKVTNSCVALRNTEVIELESDFGNSLTGVICSKSGKVQALWGSFSIGGYEVDILVGTDVRDGNGTTHVINWCGCLVQDPYPAVRALGFLPKGGGAYVTRQVLCFWWYRGSPADRYGLRARRWIVEVNGKPTPDLDAFVNVTKVIFTSHALGQRENNGQDAQAYVVYGAELGSEEFVRVKTINLDGRPSVLTLKQDLHYWPTWEVRFDPDSALWRRNTIKALHYSNP
ncbi:hypothetical protein Tsubulata_001862 [Turnera subulata]|uniref:PDZ domain-containing protein n=1 Tax=Turnera subulata TaxID=218843 RepID=A0A9Q0FES9_9ROSI|nr:hypothetical protein Tsubulata_001862 [Turnera subulata]